MVVEQGSMIDTKRSSLYNKSANYKIYKLRVENFKVKPGNTKGGSITVLLYLLFDWFGLVCFANKNKKCKLSYS